MSTSVMSFGQFSTGPNDSLNRSHRGNMMSLSVFLETYNLRRYIPEFEKRQLTLKMVREMTINELQTLEREIIPRKAKIKHKNFERFVREITGKRYFGAFDQNNVNSNQNVSFSEVQSQPSFHSNYNMYYNNNDNYNNDNNSYKTLRLQGSMPQNNFQKQNGFNFSNATQKMNFSQKTEMCKHCNQQNNTGLKPKLDNHKHKHKHKQTPKWYCCYNDSTNNGNDYCIEYSPCNQHLINIWLSQLMARKENVKFGKLNRKISIFSTKNGIDYINENNKNFENKDLIERNVIIGFKPQCLSKMKPAFDGNLLKNLRLLYGFQFDNNNNNKYYNVDLTHGYQLDDHENDQNKQTRKICFGIPHINNGKLYGKYKIYQAIEPKRNNNDFMPQCLQSPQQEGLIKKTMHNCISCQCQKLKCESNDSIHNEALRVLNILQCKMDIEYGGNESCKNYGNVPALQLENSNDSACDNDDDDDKNDPNLKWRIGHTH